MDRKQIAEQTFLDSLADIILSKVDEQGYGFRAVILEEGHFNGRVFSKETMFNQYVCDFLRLMLNIEDNIGPEEFMPMWMKMGEVICKTGDSEDLKLINDNHGKKSSNNS